MRPTVPAASLVGRRLVNVAERRREYDETLHRLCISLENFIEDLAVVKQNLRKDFGPDGEKSSANLAACVKEAEAALWFARLARRDLP